jgi:hypothetical protein
VTIPDVYCGIPKSEQDAISKYKGKFHIEGPPGLNQPSNSIDVQIAKRPLQATNPYRTILGPFYDPKAPNATVAYRGSTLVLLPCKVEKAVITGVKNASNFPIRLSASGNAMSSGIGLSGGASTSAFNDKEMSVQWEAIGPQSDRSHSQMIILEVSWKETAR